MKKQIDFLRKMTDDFGMIQFSNSETPDIKSGYTIDDVSRALIVSSNLNLEDLSKTYFDFIKNSQIKDGRFINVYSENREPLENYGSEDSFGRTLWALGEHMKNSGEGEETINNAINAIGKFGIHYPISEAFTILGLTKINEAGLKKEKTKKLIDKLSESLIDRTRKHADINWFWPSNEMSYENSRIPQSLLRAYNATGRRDFLEYSKSLTYFLDTTVFEKENYLNVIGNNTSGLDGTWLKKGGKKPKFDEQPVDAGGMVELHSEIYQLTRNPENFKKAEMSLDWFKGKNRLNKNMISQSGGVFDGLNENYVNPNQGAESLLSYMMAKIKFKEMKKNGI